MDNSTPILKVCRVCAESKPATFDYFYRDTYTGGVRNICKVCANVSTDRQKAKERYALKVRNTNPAVATQVCTKCGIEKDLAGFTPAKNGLLGVSTICKTCRCARLREKTFERNSSPEAVAARLAKVEQQRLAAEARKQAREAKKQAREAYFASRRPGKADRKRALDRQSYVRTREARMAYVKKWCEENPEKSRSYKHTNRCKRLAAEGTFTAADVAAKLKAQKGKCYWCGKKLLLSGPDKFQIDHHQPVARGGSNWPSNIVCACRPCNNSKSARTPWDFNGRLL